MKKLGYLYCCSYYYAKRTGEINSLLLALFTGAFIVHKLVSWVIWVMSL